MAIDRQALEFRGIAQKRKTKNNIEESGGGEEAGVAGESCKEVKAVAWSRVRWRCFVVVLRAPTAGANGLKSRLFPGIQKFRPTLVHGNEQNSQKLQHERTLKEQKGSGLQETPAKSNYRLADLSHRGSGDKGEMRYIYKGRSNKEKNELSWKWHSVKKCKSSCFKIC